METHIINPRNSNSSILENIANLIFSWWQNYSSKDTIKKKIIECPYIGYILDNDRIITCCTIKLIPARTKKIFSQLWNTDSIKAYSHELWYIATQESERGKWYAFQLISKFISDPVLSMIPLYAVTKDVNIPMQKILIQVGFFQYWKDFPPPYLWGINTLRLLLLRR